MKVSIITEGFQDTGYGHVTRCLSIYQAFEEKNIIPTLYINGDENVKLFVDGTNYKIVDWLQHPAKLTSDIVNSDILIIDSYHAGKEIYEILSKFSKHTLFLDDYIRLAYPKGTVLNGTINSEKFDYKKNPGTEYLLGVKYIPIRKEFWKAPQRKIKKDISNILITYGGQDIKNFSEPTLNVLHDSFPEYSFNIVIGNLSAKSKFNKLSNDKCRFHYSINASKMLDLMIESDIAVSAAGQTLYELAVTGTPTIAVAVAENQRANIVQWKKSGFLLDTIYHTDANYLKKIVNQINSMTSITVRKKLSANGKNKVDGQGSRRVVEYLLKKTLTDNSFYLRKATLNDTKSIFDLSNDIIVREQSINKKFIEWEHHLTWMEEKLKNQNYYFLLAFDKTGDFIGQLRFEIHRRDAVVSISLVKKFRGKGFSKKILAEGCTKLYNEFKNIDRIIAYIRSGNTSSIKSFESVNFSFCGEEIVNDDKYLKYIHKNTSDENKRF